MNTSFNHLQRLKKSEPFSKRLNDWINKWFENNQHLFVFVDEDPFDENDLDGTLKNMWEDYAENQTIKIWKGASDNTIFGSAEMNWKFRAWHDYIHVIKYLGFDLLGESLTAQYQIEMLPKDWYFERDLVRLEIIGQAQYFMVNGEFINDQRLFVNVAYNVGISTALHLKKH